MTSIVNYIFENNFIEKCIEDSFFNINCIMGTSTLLFSLIIIILNIIALFKLAHYYGKINFETNLILFSILQVITIELVIITSYEVLISYFFLIQTFIITLIIRKFIIISEKPIHQFKKNGLFLFLNTINMLLFIIYLMFLFKNNKDSSYSIILIHSLFYSLCAFILTFYSNLLVKLINKYKNTEFDESSQYLPQLSNEKENIRENSNSISSFDSNNNIKKKEIFFYSMRKKQIKALYILNIICSIFEFLLILSIIIFPFDNFKKNQFKITPISSLGYILFYIYLIICLFNISANFLCFFWEIRGQYKGKSKNSKLNTKKQKRIIDNRDIRRETINMKNEEPEQVNDFLENDSKKDGKKLEKSIYMSSFTDINEDKQEDYFVKPPNEEVKENNNNNLENKENKDENINEQSVNKELLEPLNNFDERESIPYINVSCSGINRNTTLSISKIEQDV